MVDLIAALASEEDEIAIFTVIIDRNADGVLVLRHGALIVVPVRCGEVAWGNWQREQGGADLGFCPADLPPQFLHETDQWVAGRCVVALAEARTWLRTATASAQAQHGPDATTQLVPALGEIPPFYATLRLPLAVTRVFTQTDTPAANFVTGAVRPVRSFVWRGDERPPLLLPSEWDMEGETVIAPTLCLLGINVPTDGVPQAGAPPFGLLVGRIERRAWLGEMRGDGTFEQLHVNLGWEPDRIDLADLALELEQQVDGEVVSRNRFPLENLSDLDQVRDRGLCTVDVPTVGRGTAFEVSLATRDHELLDRIGPYPLLERASITFNFGGTSKETISVGDASTTPTLLPDHLERLEELNDELKGILQQGAENRILEDRSTANATLTAELERARGELLVHDRYFGQEVHEWELLRDVRVPIRVLTGKIADDVADIPAHVQARFRPKAPMHERVYLWDGGGLSLGGSPTTFGQAPVGFSRIDAASADAWRKRFEVMWKSEHFRPVPRIAEGDESES